MSFYAVIIDIFENSDPSQPVILLIHTMQSENFYALKISPLLAKAVQKWIPRIPSQEAAQAGVASISDDGALRFNSKNIRSLLMHADDTAGQIETFRLKKQAHEILKMDHQKISAFGSRRLSLEDDILDLQNTEIGSYLRS